MIVEHNSWEGETWRHYFEDGEGVKDALAVGPFMCAELRGPELVELSVEEAEARANLDDGEYMQAHWFGRLTDQAGLKAASEDDLYKGGIRKFGESVMETVVLPERCPCGCCHETDYGACADFEAGMNGRCVYCDHGEGCHPGAGPLANGPLGPQEIGAPPAPETEVR
jgi:hypothetical protein